MFISFVNPYLTENLKFTKNDTTLMYVVGGLCVALSSSYVGMQIDKIGKYKSFVILIILSFIPILAIAHLQRGSLVLSLVLCAMLFVFSSGRMMAAMTLLTGAPTEQQRSKFLAIRSAIIEFSEGIAVSIGGLILSKNQVDGTIENYSILSYITVVVGILCIFLAKRVKIREQD
ncbi:MAG: MFS transporter [Sphingobacteriales bacterium]|nr:MAG: MFS transporter [Sphingobacteriales bacterium]